MKEKSIVVLPFINLSSDPENEYFSDGITEEIINALTTINDLKVIARTSSFAYKNRNLDVRTIGAELGVTTVLEGSVRKVNNRIRITAQLINTENGFHIWSRNFDRNLDDIFALQDEISLLIADQVRENFGHLELADHLINIHKISAEAYELYLKGKYFLNTLNKYDIFKGIEFLEKVTSLQPDFPLAWVNIHYGYNMMAAAGYMPAKIALEKGINSLNRAMEIDGSLPECYHSLGWHSLNYKWDFIGAKKHLIKAIELSPGYADAHQKLFITLALEGNKEDAWTHLKTALNLDPLSPLNHYFKGYYFYITENYSEAVNAFENCFELAPHFLFGYCMYGLSLIAEGNADLLLKKTQVLIQMEGGDTEKQIITTLTHTAFRDLTKVDQGINQLKKKLEEEDGERARFFLIHIYTLLENYDESLDLIEEGISKQEPLMTLLREDPLLKVLHGYDRFQMYMQQIFLLSDNSVPQKPPSLKDSRSDEEFLNYKIQLEELMANNQLYLDNNLSLRSLAEHLKIHPNKLSWLLNEYFKKNFNEYINSLRLDEFKRKALNPAYKHLSILGLAYESGFNSKTVFNTFFKNVEGVTPGNWLKSQKHQRLKF